MIDDEGIFEPRLVDDPDTSGDPSRDGEAELDDVDLHVDVGPDDSTGLQCTSRPAPREITSTSAHPHHTAQEERIADAVRSVVARGGVEAVTLRNVAAEAEVSMGGLQHYFSTRSDLLGHALDRARKRMHARIEARVAETDRSDRAILFAALDELLGGHVETCEALRMHTAFAASPTGADRGWSLTGRDDEFLALATAVIAERQARSPGVGRPDPAADGLGLWTLARALAFDIALHGMPVARAHGVLQRQLEHLDLVARIPAQDERGG